MKTELIIPPQWKRNIPIRLRCIFQAQESDEQRDDQNTAILRKLLNVGLITD